jgi:flagellar hook-basal body complex protein FliE
MNINGLPQFTNPIGSQGIRGARPPIETKPTNGLDFNSALQSLSRTENRSNELIEMLAAGEDVDVHQVMIAVEETDVNFRVAMAIRDRLVESYQEVMRMAV